MCSSIGATREVTVLLICCRGKAPGPIQRRSVRIYGGVTDILSKGATRESGTTRGLEEGGLTVVSEGMGVVHEGST